MADDVAYVELPFEIDEQQIQDAAIDRLQARWPNWKPADGGLATAMLEIGASYASSFGFVAAQMPAAALANFGLKLYSVPAGLGSPAHTTITLTVASSTDVQIVSGGSELNIDGVAFAVYQDTPVPAGDASIAGVPVYSRVNAAAANGLIGDTWAQLSLPSFVTGVSVDSPTEGGSDPQTPRQYLDTFSGEVRLRAKSIVVARDFEIEALAFSQEIGRVQAIGNRVARQVDVVLATAEGEVVSTPTKTGLAAHYDEFELANDVYVLHDPDYAVVSVVWSADKLPGPAYDTAALEAQGNALLSGWLTPASFNRPASGQPGSTPNWVGDSTIYRNDVIARLANIPGMMHILDVTLSAPGLAVDGDGNLTLPGMAPLPRPGVMSGTVT